MKRFLTLLLLSVAISLVALAQSAPQATSSPDMAFPSTGEQVKITTSTTVSKDTVAYAGSITFSKIVKSNDLTGESSVVYYAIIPAMKNKKIRISKSTFELQKANALIYTNKKDGSRKLTGVTLI